MTDHCTACGKCFRWNELTDITSDGSNTLCDLCLKDFESGLEELAMEAYLEQQKEFKK